MFIVAFVKFINILKKLSKYCQISFEYFKFGNISELSEKNGLRGVFVAKIKHFQAADFYSPPEFQI